mmetsp:Transcript_43449/g.102039  ORF Transcript_43449/g.102039 Transcript_43449/m.102039 type:complete len:214 (+) Transcript_43449:858-1499(+)
MHRALGCVRSLRRLHGRAPRGDADERDALLQPGPARGAARLRRDEDQRRARDGDRRVDRLRERVRGALHHGLSAGARDARRAHHVRVRALAAPALRLGVLDGARGGDDRLRRLSVRRQVLLRAHGDPHDPQLRQRGAAAPLPAPAARPLAAHAAARRRRRRRVRAPRGAGAHPAERCDARADAAARAAASAERRCRERCFRAAGATVHARASE